MLYTILKLIHVHRGFDVKRIDKNKYTKSKFVHLVLNTKTVKFTSLLPYHTFGLLFFKYYYLLKLKHVENLIKMTKYNQIFVTMNEFGFIFGRYSKFDFFNWKRKIIFNFVGNASFSRKKARQQLLLFFSFCGFLSEPSQLKKSIKKILM
jgi:hypothetical protein